MSLGAPLSFLRRHLYAQVLLAVALGILVGVLCPAQARALEPLGTGFIKLIKMIVVPIIFCSVVHGIASMADLKKLGRVGGKTLLYFEVVSTFALILGLAVVNWWKPGAGFNVDPASLGSAATHTYAEKAHELGFAAFLLGIIPNSFLGALTGGELLPALLVAILSAFAISHLGDKRDAVLQVIDTASEIVFGVMRMILRLAPIGAFGAMAFTVGTHGLGALGKLGELMLAFYATSLLFVVVVLGTIARAAGFSIFRLLGYLKEEFLLVLGTSSSESALPGLIRKMRNLGCAESTVGLVIPTGYSFNLDGTNIYMTMAAVFLAQATNTALDLHHQITLLLVAMVSSKGASGVTGGGFVTLAATLAAVHTVPVESIALIVGIDRFMSECRALTNLAGNSVATLVISRWERELTAEELSSRLAAATPD